MKISFVKNTLTPSVSGSRQSRVWKSEKVDSFVQFVTFISYILQSTVLL